MLPRGREEINYHWRPIYRRSHPLFLAEQGWSRENWAKPGFHPLCRLCFSTASFSTTLTCGVSSNRLGRIRCQKYGSSFWKNGVWIRKGVCLKRRFFSGSWKLQIGIEAPVLSFTVSFSSTQQSLVPAVGKQVMLRFWGIQAPKIQGNIHAY